MRTSFAAAATVAAVALLAVPAAAKDGVRAKLEQPVALAGAKTVTIKWRLVDEDGQRFGASGIYLRVSACGRAPVKVRATRSGDGYEARVTIPPRGLRKVIVGLEAFKTFDGRT